MANPRDIECYQQADCWHVLAFFNEDARRRFAYYEKDVRLIRSGQAWHSYQDGHLRVASDVYGQMNSPTRPNGRSERSLSKGDVLAMRPEGSDQRLFCAVLSYGFDLLFNEELGPELLWLRDGTILPGLGATYSPLSDCSPFTITWVSKSGREITMQEDEATIIRGSAQDGSAEYEYARDTQGREMSVTLRKDGRWRPKGGSTGSVSIGFRREYRDPSF